MRAWNRSRSSWVIVGMDDGPPLISAHGRLVGWVCPKLGAVTNQPPSPRVSARVTWSAVAASLVLPGTSLVASR
jgi:hypothetical protein